MRQHIVSLHKARQEHQDDGLMKQWRICSLPLSRIPAASVVRLVVQNKRKNIGTLRNTTVSMPHAQHTHKQTCAHICTQETPRPVQS